jgi:hypothetical protein
MVKLPEQGFFQSDSKYEKELWSFLKSYAVMLTYTPPTSKVEGLAMQYANIEDELNAGTYTLTFREAVTIPQSFTYKKDNSQKYKAQEQTTLTFSSLEVEKALTYYKPMLPKSLKKLIILLNKHGLPTTPQYFGDAPVINFQEGGRRRQRNTRHKKYSKRHTRRRR